MRSLIRPAALALATLLAGCSTAGDNPFSQDPFDSARRAVTVEVVNNNWADMRVYAVRLGARHRIGTVTSMTNRTLEIPVALGAHVGEVELLADPIGGGEGYRTGPITVSSGERIDFTIENHLAVSSYSVFRR